MSSPASSLVLGGASSSSVADDAAGAVVSSLPAVASKRTGKTPPPQAPSALFAKRARELQNEAAGPYRPPALRNGSGLSSSPAEGDAAAADAGIDVGSPYGSSYRRARAGTLPSNLAAAAQRYLPPQTPAGVSSVDSAPSTTSPSTTPGGGPANITPALRQVLTSAANNGRGRSGSLTLPASGLSNAFGPSVFSSSWLAGRSSLNQSTRPATYGDMSPAHSIESFENDAQSTLDYLGLAEPHANPSYVPATLSDLRAQAQQQIQQSRIRASTISSPYRGRSALMGAFTADSLGSDAGSEDLDLQLVYEDALNYPIAAAQQPYGAPPQMLNGFRNSPHLSASNRPRATSVGTLLDSPKVRLPGSPAVLPGRAGAFDYATAPVVTPGQDAGLLAASAAAAKRPGMYSDRSYSDMDISHIQQLQSGASVVRFLNEGAQSTSNTPRSHTPELGLGMQQQQQMLPPPQQFQQSIPPPPPQPPVSAQIPTRSLWIGNLDPEMTTQELLHIFHTYGAIESLRLLPDKECGFVNFVEKDNAIRAMDDVRNRLGGHISSTGAGAPVRVGFGKIDSVPPPPEISGGGAGGPSFGAGSGAGGADSQSSPTRALWVGSIPSSTTPARLLTIFSPFGPIESVRVLTHKNCGFVNFERLDSATVARKTLNGRDILGPEVGAIRIGFARVPVKAVPGSSPDDSAMTSNLAIASNLASMGDMSVGASIHALRQIKGAGSVPADQQVLGGSIEDYRSNLVLDLVTAGEHTLVGNSTDGLPNGGTGRMAPVSEEQMLMRILSGGDASAEADVQAVADFSPPASYYTSIPLINDRPANRRFDASKLRDIKKRIDSPGCTTAEIDEVANDILDECVDLSSDHIGNTVIQKVYERCSAPLKLSLLERIAPHLAMIGIHKNGTWAAQKIIDCSTTPEEIAIIAQNLRPYTPPLLLDQFGNYVVSICMRFGSPVNDFIFDAICDRLWDIAQGRFGARSLRTCLESNHTTLKQKKRVAIAIILISIPLATSQNGALLITWLVDTSALPGRFRLLAPRFAPHLAHLCTHKLASVAVLRLINQRTDLEASQLILTKLFSSPNDQVLIDVLGDQIHGVNVIQKIITSTALDAAQKAPLIEATKRVLLTLQVSASQSYRRLLEDVGLPHVSPPPSQQSNYSGAIHYSTRQQPGTRYAPPPTGAYSPYGLTLPTTYDPLMMGMSALSVSGNTWNPTTGANMSAPVPRGIGHAGSFGQVMGGVGSDLYRQGTPPTFSPTSDPFNPFSSPPRSDRGLPSMGRRSSRNNDKGSSGRSTPSNSNAYGFENGVGSGFNGGAQQMDWQRRQQQQQHLQEMPQVAGYAGQV